MTAVALVGSAAGPLVITNAGSVGAVITGTGPDTASFQTLVGITALNGSVPATALTALPQTFATFPVVAGHRYAFHIMLSFDAPPGILLNNYGLSGGNVSASAISQIASNVIGVFGTMTGNAAATGEVTFNGLTLAGPSVFLQGYMVASATGTETFVFSQTIPVNTLSSKWTLVDHGV